MPESLLHNGRRAIIGDAGFAGYVEVAGWQPAPLAADQRGAINEHVRFYEDVLLSPGEPEDIAVRITALLGHWRERDGQSDGERAMIAADWMKIVGRYPTWAVCRAAEEWLEYNRHRPTVAEIRMLCDDAIRDDRLTLRLLSRLLTGTAAHTGQAVAASGQTGDR